MKILSQTHNIDSLIRSNEALSVRIDSLQISFDLYARQYSDSSYQFWDSIDLSLFIPLATLTVGILAREFFSLLRERRQDKKGIAENFQGMLKLNYLGEEVNEHRAKIDRKGGVNHKLDDKDVNIYKLMKALQQAGVSCILNASTLHFLLANAPQIVRDWLLGKNHVIHLRSSQLSNIEAVPFSRRHGEWLALTAYIWLCPKGYTLPKTYDSVLVQFEEEYKSNSIILKKEELLFDDIKSGSIYSGIKSFRKQTRKQFKKWSES